MHNALNANIRSHLKISPVEMHHRNYKNILHIPLDKEKMNKLQRLYFGIPGEPPFLHDLFHLKPSRHREGLYKKPELYPIKDYDKYTVMTMPNPPFTNHEQLMQNPKEAKNNDAGFALVTWFLHPTSIEGTLFESDKRTQINETLESISKVEDLRLGKTNELENTNKSLERKGLKRINSFSAEYRTPLSESESNHSREKRTGIPYLAASVDIAPEHLQMLKQFKQDMLQHLEEEYDVSQDNGDYITMYFHLFHSKTAVTLHMHTRVNQGLHPFEEANGLFLDDVIAALEKNKSFKDMIAEKGYHYSIVDPFLCDNFETEQVPNRFSVTNENIVNPAFKESSAKKPISMEL